MSDLKVVCQTADSKSSTVTKTGLTFDRVQNVTNVVPAHADFGDDFKFVKQCNFILTATESPKTQILMLLDNLAYDLWVVPRGQSDCVLPPKDSGN